MIDLASVRAVRDRAAVRSDGDGEAADHRRHGRGAGGSPARGRGDRAAGPGAHGSGIGPGRPARPLAEGERDGFYQAQLIRELAVRHVTSWTGVELEGGPAPPTPENIAAVMELYPVGERFFQEFTLRQVLLNAAKNGSGPSAAGTSSRAEGPNTAEPAATTACPAPEASLEPTAALPLPRARLDQPPGARGLGRAARLPGPAAARAERPRDRHRHGRGAQDRAARGCDLAVLSELLPAAEAGLVEALCADADRPH